MKLVPLVAALACAVAVNATAALGASPGRTIVGTFQDVAFGPPTPACSPQTLFQVDFSLVSPQGEVLGAGVSCVQGWAGPPCPDPAPIGCHQSTVATFVLSFPEGSVSAPMILSETFIAGGSVVQQGRGEIAGGTGAYEGATGSLEDNGIVSFTAGIHLTFVARIR